MSPPTVPEFFCDRYYVSVYRYIQRSVRSADVAADLTQEVFLRIVRGLRTYEYRGSEAAWVFTVARHVLATHAAAASQATRLVASSQTAPSSEAPTQLFYASLTEALEALPPEARDPATTRRPWPELPGDCGHPRADARSRPLAPRPRAPAPHAHRGVFAGSNRDRARKE